MGYLHEEKELFRQAVTMTSRGTAMMERAVEKDYYVTVILRLLAERIPVIVFKGGTSLSKCHGAIRRFSEDIDLAIDAELSRGQKKRLKYIIVDIAAELGLQIQNLDEVQSKRNYNRYVVAYHSVLSHPDDLLNPTVLLETSYVVLSFPAVPMEVDSFVGAWVRREAPEMAKRYGLEPFQMKVQGIDRTLADKVFAICDYYLRGETARHSRHIYDIYKLLPRVPQDEAFKKLVREVREVRMGSEICPSAQKDINIPLLLRQVIEEQAYRSDYQRITGKLLEEEVSYDTAIAALEEIAENGMFEDT